MEHRFAFPVLLSFRVTGYQLFPGRARGGIAYDVPPGVSVIAGINGLGKTTLLNMLFRSIVGPRDWKRRRLDQPAGSTPITLDVWKTPTYFQARVADLAEHASISVELAFGDERVQVTRRLRDLSVTELTVSGSSLAPSQEAFEDVVLRLSGLPSYPDYFLVVRYLVFFLEERQAVVWDPTAQSDVLQVLFFDAGAAVKYRSLYDSIQSLDSRRRNLRVQLRKQQEALRRATAQVDSSPDVRAHLAATETRLKAVLGRCDDLERSASEANRTRRSQRLLVEQAKLTLADTLQGYEGLEEQYLQQVFPALDHVTQHLLLRVGSGGGCLVCGSRREGADEHVRESLRMQRCPVCESDLQEQEDGRRSARPAVAELEAADREVHSAANALREREEGLRLAQMRYHEVATALQSSRLERDTVGFEVDELRRQVPPTPEELDRLAGVVRSMDQEARKFRAEQRRAEGEFRTLIQAGESRIRDVAARVMQRFASFAGHFLAERVQLNYEPQERRIGQEGEAFTFPRFTVSLSSAVAPDTLTLREEPHEVSESQKEFIDLAFRMALLDVASDGGATMLVLETPEASLDSLFVARAGQLLGRFAEGGGEVGNRLIASSNVTKGDMIAALLGALPVSTASGPRKPRKSVPYSLPLAERRRRVVNLLELARENAALRKNHAAYTRELERAINPASALGKSKRSSKPRWKGRRS